MKCNSFPVQKGPIAWQHRITGEKYPAYLDLPYFIRKIICWLFGHIPEHFANAIDDRDLWCPRCTVVLVIKYGAKNV